ncbi:unnamed protein product [Penicillium nalgiovense]|uniref:J domain-containing protein n=2 Tax=Penicillium TaxID=5073 RepID=A0A9W4HIU8_PENNA|nr:unnamed protein product [Penicillium salamii]CAG7952376.1 unnamed protein product [Penicillium nalgiovense]CAG7959190.1 unnamed protein product [Penicillium salamii]CAG7967199.1 unnamed protein product [Penicillium salamii]CAG7975759.1 unnamed protein product [Penicillium salamii]
MYRKAACNAHILLSSTRQSICLNGTTSERSPGRRDSFSTKKKYRASHYSTWPSSDRPTPYQVMGIQRGHKYSRTRYYDLVKIYHPDSSTSDIAKRLPTEERLSRYRLIVDAHEILSDQQKRSAYDAYGLGWPLPSRHHGYDNIPQSPRHTYERWDDIDSEHGAVNEFLGRLLKNKKFICLMIVLATFAQACVILSSVAKTKLEMRRRDEECRDLIFRHRDRALDLRTLVAQMERLLLKRDPSGMGLGPTEEPFYREMLPFCGN